MGCRPPPDATTKESLCKTQNGALLYASNFSVGVNILFAMNKKLADIMNAYPDYKISIEEIHHTGKLDAPSGTAISLAEQIIERVKRGLPRQTILMPKL